jgi:hypothetical protein
MTDSILTLPLGVVVDQVTSWPPNLPVGRGRGLLAQRYGRYVAGSAGHRDRTRPDLATALIHRYSNPGDLILDPFAGTGTMLVEAIHAGRDRLGMDIEPGWMSLARANLAHAARQECRRRLGVLGDPEPGAGQCCKAPGHERLAIVIEQLGTAIAVQTAQCTEHAHPSRSPLTLAVPGRGWAASKRRFDTAVQRPLTCGAGACRKHSADGSGHHATALPRKEKSTYHRRSARRGRDTQARFNLLVTGQTAERKSSRCRPQPLRLPRLAPPWVAGSRRRADLPVRSHVDACAPVGRR